MAHFEKTKSNKWRCSVMVDYKRRSKTFKTKQEGNAWAVEVAKNQVEDTIPSKTLGELLDEYYKKVSINKKGERWERVRIEKFKRDKIAKIKIADLKKYDFADWRDRRMTEVSNLSVLREWALLNHAIQISIDEWEWLTINPMKGLKKPVGEPPRDKLITSDEISRLTEALNYTPYIKPEMVSTRVGGAFLFAIETALRAQEICNLKWSDLSGRVAKINAAKTRAGVRDVPLSPRALEIIKQFKGVDTELVFNIKTSQLDSVFRKAKSQTLIKDLHFHDTRHLAITNMAGKFKIFELARAVGHKDLRMLMIYYNETAENLADKL